MRYFTSDTHFGHKNLVYAITNWHKNNPHLKSQDCRDFESVKHMDDVLIDNINNLVQENDELIHNGDFALLKYRGKEQKEEAKKQLVKYRERINCKNIHLTLGNHDEFIRFSEVVYYPESKYANKQGYVQLRSLFNSVQDSYQISFKYHLDNQQKTEKPLGKVKIYLNHYPNRVWPASHHGSWHLYGHSHANLDRYVEWGKSMDVGVDNAYRLLGEYRPFSFGEIKEIMKNRKIKS